MAAQGKHAPWRLWILIVLWVLQLLLLGYSIVVYIIAIIAVAKWDDDFAVKPSIGVLVAHMCFLILAFILTVLEIAFLARRGLKPWFYLVSNACKAIPYTALTVAGIVIEKNDSDEDSTFMSVTIVVAIITILCFVLPSIYGLIIVIKSRRNPYRGPGGSYNTVDPLLQRPTAYASAPGDVELGQHAYDHQKDTRFEAYRQSSYGGNVISVQTPGYAMQPGTAYGASYDTQPVPIHHAATYA